MLQTKTILHDLMNNYKEPVNEDFYIIIESDGENNPRILTDSDGITLKFYNRQTVKGVLETLNKNFLTHYYLEKITF